MGVRLPGAHQQVRIDTRVWIYHPGDPPELGPPAGRVIESREAGRFRTIASELTLLELTVRPLQLGRQDIADHDEVLLDHFPSFEIVPVSR